jgi:hypothetical protein
MRNAYISHKVALQHQGDLAEQEVMVHIAV